MTICTHNFKCFFGRVENEKTRLTPIGAVAERFWQAVPNHFENCEMDAFVVMPNHMHGILFIHTVGAQYIVLLQNNYNQFQRIVSQSVSSIIRSYKASVTQVV